MKKLNVSVLTAIIIICLSACSRQDSTGLQEGFLDPPDSVKPWTYWFFYNDHISKEGIDLDLAAMKKADIGTALLFTHVSMGGNTGEVKALTDEWWNLVKYAIRRAGEEGIELGLFNCFGWSQSGGPWNTNEQTMRHLLAPEIQLNGPMRYNDALPSPKGFYQDVRVLAFPTPLEDRNQILAGEARITGRPISRNLSNLIDGDTSTVYSFPESAIETGGEMVIDIRTKSPVNARSLLLHPSENQFLVNCEFLAKDSEGEFQTIRKFDYQRPPGGGIMDIGPLHNGPASVSFPTLESDHFRLVFNNFAYHPHFGRAGSQPGFREIEISSAYRIDSYVEKQLSKVFPMPLPEWDSYIWDSSNPEDDPDLVIAEDGVLDISDKLKDGVLDWEVPPGDWTILRVCMVPTGAINAPVLPEAEGPEIDKLSKELAFHQFEGFAGRLIREIPEEERTSLKYLVIDSYEKGSQNWTDDLEVDFREAYGYNPVPYLPVFSGRAVGSAEKSERFMWDLRRLIADRVSHEYVGGLREISNRNGMKLWVENYGHWGYPGEMLQYGGAADVVSGEFWTKGDLGSIELRAASSSAHIYGKTLVCAESFTSSAPHFVSHPWFFKLRGDWSFTEGVNQTLLTEYLHQSHPDSPPGVNAWFGTAFNRHNTWFFRMGSWTDYLKRCNYMLQQGLHVADVAYFIGEDAPKMTGIRDPELPDGYAYDYINGEVILERLEVKDGRFVLPDGMSYKLLVLPPLDNMRPELLQKIHQMVQKGGSIYGEAPTQSPSLQNFPEADTRVKEMAAELWPGDDSHYSFGEGNVFRGPDLESVLKTLNTDPDVHMESDVPVLWTHRSTGDREIYFLCNQSERKVRFDPVFRVKNMIPETWDAARGEIMQTCYYESLDEGTRVSLELGPRESVFVVFRQGKAKTAPVLSVSRDTKKIFPKAWISGSEIMLDLEENGSYTIHRSGGATENIEVAGLPAVQTIEGPWKVRFTPGRDAPEETEFEDLQSWTKSTDDGIKYYSGSAVYLKSFDALDELFGENHRILMDLGNVGNIARVKLNGTELGEFWHFPMELDVTGQIEEGNNELEIEVTGTWWNRLVGDALYPDAFPSAGGEPKEFSTFLVTDLNLTGSENLEPSGLMGPVTVGAVKRVMH